jgi:hypothetical protein
MMEERTDKRDEANRLFSQSPNNAEALLVASKETGLDVGVEKTKYMVMSRHQHGGQNNNTKTGNKTFEIVEQFRYVGTTLTNQNSIHEEIKCRLKSWTACSHSVQNLLLFSLLSKNTKIKTFSSVVLFLSFYGCETWFFTRREEHRPRVFENLVLRKIRIWS